MPLPADAVERVSGWHPLSPPYHLLSARKAVRLLPACPYGSCLLPFPNTWRSKSPSALLSAVKLGGGLHETNIPVL